MSTPRPRGARLLTAGGGAAEQRQRPACGSFDAFEALHAPRRIDLRATLGSAQLSLQIKIGSAMPSRPRRRPRCVLHLYWRLGMELPQLKQCALGIALVSVIATGAGFANNQGPEARIGGTITAMPNTTGQPNPQRSLNRQGIR